MAHGYVLPLPLLFTRQQCTGHSADGVDDVSVIERKYLPKGIQLRVINIVKVKCDRRLKHNNVLEEELYRNLYRQTVRIEPNLAKK